MLGLETAFAAIGKVLSDDGHPLVDTHGLNSTDCDAWRKVMRDIDEELVVWSRAFRKKYGAAPDAATEVDEEESSTVEASWEREEGAPASA